MSLPVPQQPNRQRVEVIDANPMLDTGRFEQIARVAGQIAKSGMAPESITHYGPANNRQEYALEVVHARCFLIVEQAIRWNMPAFAVISACSLVHGKLCYEGKLVAAVLRAKLGVTLDYEWNAETGNKFGIRVFGTTPDGKVREISGTVGDWKPEKTTAWGTPYKDRKMLANRGTREWARLWASDVLLGVYTDDEMEDLQEAARDTRRARVAPPAPTIAPPKAAAPTIEHKSAPEPVETQQADEQQEADEKAAPGDEEPAQQQEEAKPVEAAPPKKAPPPPPPSKKPQEPAQQQEPGDDQMDWDAELEAFENACTSAEAASEVHEAKQAHEHLFDLVTPKEVAMKADRIVMAALDRIGGAD